MSEGSKATSAAVLGTGIMGAAMARNLAKAGIATSAWNRTHERAQPLAADGVEVFEDATDAVRDRDVVITILSDAATTIEVMAAGPLEAMSEGTVWMQCATIGVDGTDSVIGLVRGTGIRLIDVPVSGTKTPAEQGTLVMLASGDREAADFAAPVLDAVGAKTVWLGAAGAGSRMKLVTNTWVLSQTALVAEAMRLAEGLDLEPAAFLDAIDGAPVGSPYAQIKGAMMEQGEYPPNFPLEHAAKDTRLIMHSAHEAGLDLPVAAGTAEHLAAGLAAGRGKEDVSAIYDVIGPTDAEEI